MPKNVPVRSLPASIHVRLTEQEKQEWDMLISESGYSSQDILRTVVLNLIRKGQIPPLTFEETDGD